MNIGIFLELENNKLVPVGLEIIGKTIEIMGEKAYKLHGIALISRDIKEERIFLNFEEVRSYLDELFIYEYEEKFLTTEHYMDALCKYIDSKNPSILLLGATPLGRSFGPRVAAYYRTGITADCTEIKYDDKYGLIQIRPAFGDEVFAEIITTKSFPQMATVRPGVMDIPFKSGGKKSRIKICQRKLSNGNLNIIERNERREEEAKLIKAKIVIIVGNAIKKKEDLLLVNKVAKALGGDFGVTRPLVQGGLAPYNRQVGVSGHSLSASIVLLFGVSGSNQTLSGIKKVRKVIAVNNNPNASIFNKVDIGIIDDWKNIALCILNKKGEI